MSINVIMMMMVVVAPIAMIRFTGLSSDSLKTLAESCEENVNFLLIHSNGVLGQARVLPKAEVDMFLIVKTEKIVILCPSPDLVCLMVYMSWLPSSMVLPSFLHVTLGVGLPVT